MDNHNHNQSEEARQKQASERQTERNRLDENQFDVHVYQNDQAEVVQGHAASPATPPPQIPPHSTTDPRLHIKVNGEAVLMHNGLKVRHAVGPEMAKAVENWQAIVRDRDGNIVDLDGALLDNQELFTTEYEDPGEVLEAYGFGRQDAQ